MNVWREEENLGQRESNDNATNIEGWYVIVECDCEKTHASDFHTRPEYK